MSRKYTKLKGVLLITVVSTVAWYVTRWDPLERGLELDVDRQKLVLKHDVAKVPKDMQSLRALYRTINLVQKHYIDATRIDPREMFLAAMREIQREVANVLVREQPSDLLVRIDTKERLFGIDDLSTPWILLQRMKEVFVFLQENFFEDDVDFIEVEYAAINGMLQTLDPHSVFLTPDMYRDMKDKTQGKFGGLGIVISIRDGNLTVISPIDGTPADLAGLRAGDQIIEIDEVSTVSMALNDAVTLLRGEPGTEVVLEVVRKGWEEPLTFTIVRAIIEVQSVESHLLPGKIAYVRIKDFQGNTAKDLDQHLSDMGKEGIRGLVLDLRNNPGGLLDAAIRVADRFLKQGVIVTTAGQGPTERDVRKARDDEDEPGYPIVLLVNSGSASASEIVAGALKNNDRALLIGQRTFGKGSVQVLYERGFLNDSALKLTTAQYLTPGDESIQSVGVVPHVELIPERADEEVLDLVVEAGYRESDLDHHFESAKSSPAAQRPLMTLSYLWSATSDPRAEARDDVDAGLPVDPPAQEQPFKPDFEIKLARDLALKMAQLKKAELEPATLSSVIDDRARTEEARLVRALKKLGIDWTVGPGTGAADTFVDARLTGKEPLKPGEQHAISVSVTNKGPGTLYRLYATTRSDLHALDDRELAFGQVAEGQTVTRELKFKIPKDALSRIDDVLFSFSEANQKEIAAAALRLSIEALDRPRFAYGYQIVDVRGGNGDGKLQAGESVNLVVDIENKGIGASLETYATLKSLSGTKLFMKRGRESFGKLEPGRRHKAVFSFDVKRGFDEPYAKLELAIADVDLRVYAVEKLKIPLEKAERILLIHEKVAPRGARAEVREAPDPKARVVAQMVSTSLADAEMSEYYRIRFDEDRIGWVAKEDVTKSEKEPKQPVRPMVNSPPELFIEEIDRVVRSETVRVRGKATDDQKVRDVYIFVDDQKVFFKSNANAEHPGELSFEAELPLKNGVNYVMVVAEETSNLDSREIITIRRDRPDGMAYFSPRLPHEEPEIVGIASGSTSPLATRAPVQ